MAGNRKQPFGYRMELGQVVLCPKEATVVRLLFLQYEQGMSLAALTESLCAQEIPYCEGKLWNKNMVARILEDRRYIGNSNYPQIISGAQYDSVCEKRRRRSSYVQQTEIQKALRQKCREKVTAGTEVQVLRILNNLICSPSQIVCPEEMRVSDKAVSDLEQALEDTLSQLPVDMEQAKERILRLATTRYEQLGNESYESRHLQRIFNKMQPMENLDLELLLDTVLAIHIDSSGLVRVELKNKQIF